MFCETVSFSGMKMSPQAATPFGRERHFTLAGENLN
jgi:hypothetical protein